MPISTAVFDACGTAFGLAGAAWFGFAALWMNRAPPVDRVPYRPDHPISDLTAAAARPAAS